MNKNTVIITRRSKLAYGYAPISTKEYEEGEAELPAPVHIGTIKQIRAALVEDRTLQSLRNTFHSSVWFARVGREWFAISDEQYQHPQDLLLELPEGGYAESSLVLLLR